MDVRFINPFITATVNALKTTANLEVTRGSPFVKGSFQALADISGIIGDLSWAGLSGVGQTPNADYAATNLPISSKRLRTICAPHRMLSHGR